MLFFECSEEVMTQRLLGRNEGRTDDNLATIAKRFRVFQADSLRVVEHYEAAGRVRRIAAERSPDEVYAEVRALFEGFCPAISSQPGWRRPAAAGR